jgi:hypothetical protein
MWLLSVLTSMLTLSSLEEAGMSVTGAFNMNLVLSAMSIIGVAM